MACITLPSSSKIDLRKDRLPPPLPPPEGMGIDCEGGGISEDGGGPLLGAFTFWLLLCGCFYEGAPELSLIPKSNRSLFEIEGAYCFGGGAIYLGCIFFGGEACYFIGGGYLGEGCFGLGFSMVDKISSYGSSFGSGTPFFIFAISCMHTKNICLLNWASPSGFERSHNNLHSA